ncbi:hypothetical protein P9112_004784 [Eukaryota sp. TZLM1-RC]
MDLFDFDPPSPYSSHDLHNSVFTSKRSVTRGYRSFVEENIKLKQTNQLVRANNISGYESEELVTYLSQQYENSRSTSQSQETCHSEQQFPNLPTLQWETMDFETETNDDRARCLTNTNVDTDFDELFEYDVMKTC